MRLRPRDLLEDDERLMWQRLPPARALSPGVLAIQILGHVLLTAMSVGLAICMPGGVLAQVLTGVIFCGASNAPLIIWTFQKKRPAGGRSASVYFVTDRRVGSLKASGELRQVPLTTELRLNILPDTIEFLLSEHTTVSFAGLKPKEMQLLVAALRNLMASSSRQGDAACGEHGN